MAPSAVASSLSTTFGTLNAAKDNAILIPLWYSGTNKIMEQVYIGTGRALDPDKYCIIVINQIGNGLSSSPHNTPLRAAWAIFRTSVLVTDERSISLSLKSSASRTSPW